MCRKVREGSEDLASGKKPSGPGPDPGTLPGLGAVGQGCLSAHLRLPLPEKLLGSTCARNSSDCALRGWKHCRRWPGSASLVTKMCPTEMRESVINCHFCHKNMTRREKSCLEWTSHIENVMREFSTSWGSCKNRLNSGARDIIANLIKKIKMDTELPL